mgnify:CR=1 FL=1
MDMDDVHLPLIEVSLADQQIRLKTADTCYVFPVSTALNGPGEREGSGCTPRGWHRVVARIGEGLPSHAVLVGRRPTGEIYSPQLARDFPDRDWILTRILWLQGLEVGRNRMGNLDSMRRYIYIHGTPDSEPMGVPVSHGCIRMRNDDLLLLFDRVPAGARVWIQEHSFSRIPCRNL